MRATAGQKSRLISQRNSAASPWHLSLFTAVFVLELKPNTIYKMHVSDG